MIARYLAVAALAVGIAYATPAQAFAPKQFEMRTTSFAKKFAKSQLPHWGWSNKQWGCLHQLWTKESNWRADAYNKTPVKQFRNGKWVKLHAGGIPQKLGLSPKSSVPKQINAGFEYIKARYDNPCRAMNFWKQHYWY